LALQPGIALATNWFYTRDGQTYGPVTSSEIKRLAASGQLRPHDLLWPDHADHSRAVVACTAIPIWSGNPAADNPPAALPPAKPASAPEPAPAVPVAVALAIPVPPALPVSTEQPVPQSAEAGLDPQTGRIVDPARFARWQREQARRRQEELAARPTATLAEVYLQAKRELERWIDREQNRDRIVAGDLEALCRDRALLALLEPYRCWGPGLMAKLLQHLAFLLDNRRRFYATGRGGVGGTCSGSVK
jgi:hypothetical protein